MRATPLPIQMTCSGFDEMTTGGEEATAFLSALQKATTQAQRIRSARRKLSHFDEVNAIMPFASHVRSGKH